MNKILLTIIAFSFSSLTFSADLSVGRIVEVKGEGFISLGGKTKEIRKGDQIFANSEIVVEHSGHVTFTDNADHRFHLGNSSSASIGANTVELRSGDVWFQSLNKTENYQIKTANTLVDYQGGEAILSYDAVKGKTQLMVINGIMKISNSHTPELNLSVAEGNFSFVDIGYDEGAPRDPTPVGEKTYQQLVSMFEGVLPLDKKSEAVFKHEEVKREIASEHTEKVQVAKAPELEAYKEKLLTSPEKVKKHKIVKTVKPKKLLKEETVVVQIYGLKKSNRMPASVEEPTATTAKTPVDENKVRESENLLKALNKL